jgi:hypothetical protein
LTQVDLCTPSYMKYIQENEKRKKNSHIIRNGEKKRRIKKGISKLFLN